MKNLTIKQSITNKDSLIKSYLKDIAKIPLLTLEEEVDIATKAKNGDEEARNKLVSSNLRFVVSIAKQYQGQGLELIDLISEGTIGLIEASKRFDVTRGFKFISYAVWWIRQAIIKALSEQCRTIRIPTGRFGTISKIYKTINEFEEKYQRKPTNAELEELTNIPYNKISNYLNTITKTVSFDTPFDDEEGNTLLDVIKNTNIEDTDSEYLRNNRTSNINDIINQLDNRSHDIIQMVFGLNGVQELSLDEIGKRFNITSERVRQIKDNALEKMKTNFGNTLKNLL